MNARKEFKKAWGQYRANQNDVSVPAYIDELAQADWDVLATYAAGTVFRAQAACKRYDADPSRMTVNANGQVVRDTSKYDRALMLRLERQRNVSVPAGVQCQYFATFD